MQYHSENINELALALSKAQGEMKGAVKDSNNPFFKSKYADLSSVREACKDELSKNGLSISQIMGASEQGEMYLITMLLHSSGQWIKSMLPIKSANAKDSRVNEYHVLGSAITYLRRYAWSAIIGISTEEDDDANSIQAYQNRSPKPKVEAHTSRDEKTVAITISKEEVAELESLMIKCGNEFTNKVTTFLKKNGIEELSLIPFPLFRQIKGDALSRLKEEATA
jgi:hypothetical protein